MSDANPSRRRFVIHAVVAATGLPLAARMLSQPARAQDLPPLPLDHPTAVALAYAEDVSTVTHPNLKPGSNCANCQFYTGKAGEPRGPCTLFPNLSVTANGWCSAWAKKA